MRVLLRAWPKGGGQGLERAVTRATCDEKSGDQFYVRELEYSIPVHVRASVPAEGHDVELRFEVSLREYETLRLSWSRLSEAHDCPRCPHQNR